MKTTATLTSSSLIFFDFPMLITSFSISSIHCGTPEGADIMNMSNQLGLFDLERKFGPLKKIKPDIEISNARLYEFLSTSPPTRETVC